MKKKTNPTNFFNYLIIIGISILLWVSIFSWLSQSKPYQEINLFITSDGVYDLLNETLEEEFGNESEYTIGIKNITLDDEYFSETFLTQGMIEGDLLILPESVLNADNALDWIPLTNEILNTYNFDTESYSFYQVNDTNYAIKIYDATTQTNLLSNYIEYSLEETEDYYIVINASSSNAVNNNSSYNENDLIYYVLSFLLQNHS